MTVSFHEKMVLILRFLKLTLPLPWISVQVIKIASLSNFLTFKQTNARSAKQDNISILIFKPAYSVLNQLHSLIKIGDVWPVQSVLG